MRFKPTILKLSKIGLFTFLVFCFFFSLNTPILKAEGVGEIDDDKLNLILEELNLSRYFIDIDEERIFYTPSELKEALNRPMEPRVSSLTYGGYILVALYEKNLIKSIASGEYGKKADILWNAILDINVPAQVAQLESTELLVGLINEGGGSGFGESVLLKIPKLLETGIALKTLKKLLYCNELKYYFNERYGGASSNEINYTFLDNFTYKELTSSEKEYFESLWKNWGEYYTPTGVKGNIDSGAQESLQNNIVLAIKELNAQVSQPIEEKTSLSWWQKIKNFFSQDQVSQTIEDEEAVVSEESKEEFAEAGKKEEEQKLTEEYLMEDGIFVLQLEDVLKCSQDLLSHCLLLAPASAVFPDIEDPEVNVTKLDDNVYLVEAYVDSQNTSGAMVRSYYSDKVTFTPPVKSTDIVGKVALETCSYDFKFSDYSILRDEYRDR